MSDDAQNEYEAVEIREWLESLEQVIEESSSDRVLELLNELKNHAEKRGIKIPRSPLTPYCNTIHHTEEPKYPGNRKIEHRIKNIVRWNAMAMVVRAQRGGTGVGGHISTFASCATLYEVAFNHFFRARTEEYGGDLVFFQGHSSPGVYSRAFLEGRLNEQHLQNFRRELGEGGGLSSYPHPRLMPDFWQFPTVSMGLGPLMAIYQARFARYLEDRGLKPENGGKVWAFLGDGEMDEPETISGLALASRENLDNLIFVVNCNLQRLDGPVRGNAKIIQEVEGTFRGAGWNVLKVVWGSTWDPLLDADDQNRLLNRMLEVVDGEFQKYSVEDGAYIREKFFGVDDELLKLVEHLSDDEILQLKRGGHDPEKVYAAYHKATNPNGRPTCVIAHTIKGYGLGEAGEGKNVAHNQKKLNEEELRQFRTRFSIPVNDEDLADVPFYVPPEDSEEIKYLHERRKELGGYIPSRTRDHAPLPAPDASVFDEFLGGSDGREASNTMIYGRLLSKLLRDKEMGKYIVPIIPDEARTFGMEGLFRQVGIYAHNGQLYEPVDRPQLQYYKEAQDGQILEEGINEAGAMASFIAAGTAYSNHGVPMIPFYTYYSMFGFQRIGDLVWAAGDLQTKGFMVGGTAGRTSLNGEGLQHQDGHSHVLFGCVPNVLCYDPAYGYELAVIVEEGIRRMYMEDEDLFYYLTVTTDGTYVHPAIPEDQDRVREGILKGMYKLQAAEATKGNKRAQVLGSGAILPYAVKAAERLKDYGVDADVWSVTSYGELRRDGLRCDRENMMHPEAEQQVPYITQMLQDQEGVVVATSDYMKLMPDSVRQWIPQTLMSLGTDGYGMSETRGNLRDYFEIDDRWVTFATLYALVKDGELEASVLTKAIDDLELDVDKRDPMPAI